MTMIKRVYIDNYKSLINFEWSPTHSSLIIGENGTGKSAIFEVIDKLKSLVLDRRSLEDLFDRADLSHLSGPTPRMTQTFELDLAIGADVYRYKLVLAFAANKSEKLCIDHEQLTCNEMLLINAEKGQVSTYKDDFSPGPQFMTNWSYSCFSLIRQVKENTKQILFKKAISQLFVFKLIPIIISYFTKEKHKVDPDIFFDYFVSWLQHQSKEFELMGKIQEALAASLPRFRRLRLEENGPDTEVLKIEFWTDAKHKRSAALNLSQLSDGQAVLLILYSFFAFLEYQSSNDPDPAITPVLLLDEPDCFLSLREIQPLLLTLDSMLLHQSVQLILISHHPEVYREFFFNDVSLIQHQAYFCWRDTESYYTRIRPLIYTASDSELMLERIANGDIEEMISQVEEYEEEVR
jgi:predicted ATPase